MQINDPDVVAEVRAVFERYEAALLANDNATLLGMFLDHPDTVRYGVGENQHGYAEIAAFRRSQAAFTRTLGDTVVMTYGRDCATVSTLFRRPDLPGEIGRQTQAWVRTDRGWRVAAAHVSMIDEPG